MKLIQSIGKGYDDRETKVLIRIDDFSILIYDIS